MNMDETIVVSSVIDKLLPSWEDFKHNLKHQKEELSMVQLGNHLHIEESFGAQESEKSKSKVESGHPSVHMAENKPRNPNNKGHGKHKQEYVPNNSNKKKQELVCWRCLRVGHFKCDCRNGAGNSGTNGGGNRSKDQVKRRSVFD
ncbi:cold shock domain-containing protein 3-like [Lactuca sativa]|uniref:cold shock domain-containing protein 3-like n=1 Tax=Lactuca sativa TaxID=4236 RepID=UPI000CD80B83|nr:cold shock domain-containing protein 3-like [Lactuca sativa]